MRTRVVANEVKMVAGRSRDAERLFDKSVWLVSVPIRAFLAGNVYL